jgi:hypothetical protein
MLGALEIAGTCFSLTPFQYSAEYFIFPTLWYCSVVEFQLAFFYRDKAKPAVRQGRKAMDPQRGWPGCLEKRQPVCFCGTGLSKVMTQSELLLHPDGLEQRLYIGLFDG